MRHLTEADYTRQPWKNGRGTTTELWRLERDGQLLVRLSRAAVRRPARKRADGGGTVLLRRYEGVAQHRQGVRILRLQGSDQRSNGVEVCSPQPLVALKDLPRQHQRKQEEQEEPAEKWVVL